MNRINSIRDEKEKEKEDNKLELSTIAMPGAVIAILGLNSLKRDPISTITVKLRASALKETT